jgi:hypothetical protein
VARSRTNAALIGVPLKSKSVRSLASGSLAMVSWYLIERASKELTDDLLRFMAPLQAVRHDFVEGSPHAKELQLAHEIENLGAFHQPALRKLS